MSAPDIHPRTIGEATGFWLAYYPNYAGFAVFDREIDALRYAVAGGMQVEFREWGEVR